MSASELPPSKPRPYGRRAFLALLGGGLTSFWWAGPASRILSPLSSQFSQLSADVLDAIDEIVPPGTNLNAADAGWQPPHLGNAASRRR